MKTIIESKTRFRFAELKELVTYRFLIFLFVRKDFVAKYKQNVLGPLWYFIQPLFMTVVFTIVFGNIAKIPTDGAPGPLFYLSGLTIWNYFAQNFVMNSTIFLTNAPLYSKVYFPRLSIPIANVVSNLMSFAVQLLLFWIVWGYYQFSSNGMLDVNIKPTILLIPVYLIILGMLSLGIGLIFSSLTAKYRDLSQLSVFMVQLGMYLSPIIYSTNSVSPKMLVWLKLNPVTPVVENFRYSLLGVGQFDTYYMILAFVVSAVLLLLGIVIFEKAQKQFVDTI